MTRAIRPMRTPKSESRGDSRPPFVCDAIPECALISAFNSRHHVHYLDLGRLLAGDFSRHDAIPHHNKPVTHLQQLGQLRGDQDDAHGFHGEWRR